MNNAGVGNMLMIYLRMMSVRNAAHDTMIMMGRFKPMTGKSTRQTIKMMGVGRGLLVIK